jgi:beta-glucanase (GH16 family)
MKAKLRWFGILFVFLSCRTTNNLTTQKVAIIDDFSTGFSTNWYAENHTFGNNLAHFDKENITWKNGVVCLALLKKAKNEREYTGAELRSKKMFKYGTFEVELKSSDALGVISAFFLYRPKAKKNTEIDVEISGKFPKVVTTNHWTDHKSNDVDIPLNFDSSQAFHTYTIIWKPKQIIWKVDGKIIHSTEKHVPQDEMQVIFNLWATKSIQWAGDIKDGKLPTFAYIKSFKYYPYR